MKKDQVLIINKNSGETPLECLKRFKVENPEYKGDKMTYAGRLDPLASGVLLVLVGDECKNKEKYLNLDKEYELTVLFGLTTDTLDVLGLIEDEKLGALDYFSHFTGNNFRDLLKKFEKKFSQKYPKFSSKTIKGRPLFEITRAEGIKEEDLPEKEVEIKKIEFGSFGFVSKRYLRDYARESIFSVSGNFRQNMSWCSWEKTLENFADDNLPTLTIKVFCTSGTYMRRLAQNIGKEVGLPALALRIKRTKIYLK